MTRRIGLAVGAIVVAGLLGAGCTLPKGPCNLVIAAVDEPDVQQIPADAEILVTAADVDPTGWAVSEDGNGSPAVDLRFKPEAAQRSAKHTAANVGGYLAIAIDGTVVSVPVINGPIEDGAVSINGSIDTDIVEAFAPCLPIEIRPPG